MRQVLYIGYPGGRQIPKPTRLPGAPPSTLAESGAADSECRGGHGRGRAGPSPDEPNALAHLERCPLEVNLNCHRGGQALEDKCASPISRAHRHPSDCRRQCVSSSCLGSGSGSAAGAWWPGRAGGSSCDCVLELLRVDPFPFLDAQRAEQRDVGRRPAKPDATKAQPLLADGCETDARWSVLLDVVVVGRGVSSASTSRASSLSWRWSGSGPAPFGRRQIGTADPPVDYLLVRPEETFGLHPEDCRVERPRADPVAVLGQVCCHPRPVHLTPGAVVEDVQPPSTARGTPA